MAQGKQPPKKKARRTVDPKRYRPISDLERKYWDLVNDLDNYVGAGTVGFEMPRRAAEGMEAPDGWLWLEDHRFPPRADPDTDTKKTRELLSNNLIRCTYKMVTPSEARVRVYVLPEDVGRSIVGVNTPTATNALKRLNEIVDTSKRGWMGLAVRRRKPLLGFDEATASLFYMFNTIKSPNPNPDLPWIREKRVKQLVRDVLYYGQIPGLRTVPFQYQRRSIALMIQRELAPMKTIDSRLQETCAPTGEVYYVDLESLRIYENPVYFEDVRGGILAEEMGTGKTLMCIGLIAATKGQRASPPERESTVVPSPQESEFADEGDHAPPSLADVAINTIWKNNIWWENGIPEHCQRAMMARNAYYEVTVARRSRSLRQAAPLIENKRLFLGKGTIVVCPPNLVMQWRSEMSKHVDPDFFKVLVMDKADSPIPPVQELLEYDVLLFSKSRFDRESREDMDSKGRRASGGRPLVCTCPYVGATRTRDCTCFNPSAVYKSPLSSIRFKRLIMDEGHFLGSGNKTKGATVTERLSVERRWIVSGTPSNNLLGATAGMTVEEDETEEEVQLRAERLLEERKSFQESELKDLEKLGNMVKDFLRLEPWALQDERKDQASWDSYITKGFLKHRVGSQQCVQNILERLVIRHSAQDIEKEHKLPPLYHKIVRLKPGFFEKIATNIFIMALAVNAVTSERQDEDYMFHPKNRGELRVLINNLLKESGFFWTGNSSSDVIDTVSIAQKYLKKKAGQYSPEDEKLLRKAVQAGNRALNSGVWRSLSHFHEMGYFTSGLPAETLSTWAITKIDPAALMVGASQLLEMQKFINEKAYDLAPELILGKLEDAGEDFMPGYKKRTEQENLNLHNKYKRSKLEARRGIAASSISGSSNTSAGSKTPSKPNPISTPNSQEKGGPKTPVRKSTRIPKKSALKPITHPGELPDSPAMAAAIIGTTSTKLSYLMSAVLKHHTEEKILIFYETDNVASYISQALDICGIQWLAIQKNLKGSLKAQYIVAFHHLQRFRVLLLDLSQASHGLNISSASRVYFVNSVWTPSIEAQALKRAHRIGQTRPVYVETLVLEGTLEDEMVKRRNAMSEHELKETRDSVVNDHVMRNIISNLEFYDIEKGEGSGVRQVAALERPEKMFGASKRGGPVLDDAAFLVDLVNNGEGGSPLPPTPRKSPVLVSPTIEDEEMMNPPATLNRRTSIFGGGEVSEAGVGRAVKRKVIFAGVADDDDEVEEADGDAADKVEGEASAARDTLRNGSPTKRPRVTFAEPEPESAAVEDGGGDTVMMLESRPQKRARN